MNFLVDAQLPPALARAIAAQGHQAVHVFDIGMHSASDHQIVREATRRKAVVVTKDDDFVGLLSRDSNAPPIVLIRLRNCSKQELLDAFLPSLPRVLRIIEAGEKLVELRLA